MTTKEKIIKTINEIPETKYPELYDLVENFKNSSSGKKLKNRWSRFAGILSEEEGNAMLAVIEETCESVEND